MCTTICVPLVVNSIDYGRYFFLFHWFTVTLRIMNMVSESLKIIFFIEGERALGWCFLNMSALKSSWQKSKLQTAIPLPLATNWFFCFSPRRWNLAFFSLCMASSHPLTWPRDISALLPRPAFGLQILSPSRPTVRPPSIWAYFLMELHLNPAVAHFKGLVIIMRSPLWKRYNPLIVLALDSYW